MSFAFPPLGLTHALRFRALSAAAALMLAGCQAEAPAPEPSQAALTVEGASIRVGATADRPSAAYFTIKGGPSPTVLRSITSTDVERIELHETRRENGLTMMGSIDEAAVPAGGELVFRPGGKHAMLFGISDAARTAGTVKLTLNFADGTSRALDVALSAQGGDDAMAGMAAGEHDGH